jgi:hypothetical protein
MEFTVEDRIPHAIDFMTPAPDADLHSVGQANFGWIVKEVADMAIEKAKAAPRLLELNWASFLNAAPATEGNAPKKSPAKKPAAKKTDKGKIKDVVAVE